MGDSFNKKERDKKRKKKRNDKAEKRKQRKLEGNKSEEFMYVDEDGNLTSTPPNPKKKREFKLEEIRISTPKDSDTIEEQKEIEGVVKFYDREKRFGFINEKGTKSDFFVHEDNLQDEIKDNDSVIFELGTGPKGLIAINVKLKKAERT